LVAGLSEEVAVPAGSAILQEYGGFSVDYELVYVFRNTSGLQLVPKRASALLPTFMILTSGVGSVNIVNTKARFFKLETDISPGTASTTIFNNVAGELAGTAKYKGDFPPSTFTKFNFSVTARGTDPNPTGNGKSLLKFKIVTGAVFVQQP
jgi:hypothetical protein